MENIQSALESLTRGAGAQDTRHFVTFAEFLEILVQRPHSMIRNVFQVFRDMVASHMGEGNDECDGDPESVNFMYYDTHSLFEENLDHPFFADRLFANRLRILAEDLKRGAQQNRIYIFEGPPGCGKSTFLNDLLLKFEEYANTEEGGRYEAVWRLDRTIVGGLLNNETAPVFERYFHEMDNHRGEPPAGFLDTYVNLLGENHLEIPCPSHDNPLLVIPKPMRRAFFDDLFQNDEFKWHLFTEKEYEWIFRDNACTICSSLYQALLDKLQSPKKVFDMLYARRFKFNRRIGEGISVFNPGDKNLEQGVLTNPILQKRLNALLQDSNLVRYVFSRFAKVNQGIYALMDVKSHNVERLIELHNLISEGVHKVEDTEENVNALFIALMNPEDKAPIENFQSFSDRIQTIRIPYILDLNTEVKVYRSVFGKHIDGSFLPRVLHNFARAIISTRLAAKSEAMQEWITDPKKYNLYCDENLLLLKMEIYTGHIPEWLTEEDRKRFTAQRRRKILAESEKEGAKGFSGRDSIKIFNEFFSTFEREDQLITMSMLHSFFTKVRRDPGIAIPEGFLNSLLRLYDYTVLQEVKESLYYYNEEQISRDISNYLFAVSFEPGVEQTCVFTGDRLEITEEFFHAIEARILGGSATEKDRKEFRRDTLKTYTAQTLTQEMRLEGRKLSETRLFQACRERYINKLKEKALDPFLSNENFRNAIKDYDTEAFRTYDQRIRDDVTFLMTNLCKKHLYTQQGAKEVSIYVMDHDLTRKYGSK